MTSGGVLHGHREAVATRSEDQAQLLLAGLDVVADDLANGAIVVLTPTKLRVRSLPIKPEDG